MKSIWNSSGEICDSAWVAGDECTVHRGESHTVCKHLLQERCLTSTVRMAHESRWFKGERRTSEREVEEHREILASPG
jgi:hypothetical protein